MNKTKRIAAFALSLVLAASMLSGCGDKEDDKTTTTTAATTTAADETEKINYDQLVIPDKKLVVNGEEVNTDDLIVMTINGKYQVDFDLYRCMYFTVLDELGLDFSVLDEEQCADAYEIAKQYTESYLMSFYADYVLAEKYGVEVDDELTALVDQAYESLVTDCEGEENAEKYLLSEYFTADVYKKMYECSYLYSDVYDILYNEGGEFYVSQDDFKEFAKTDDYALVKHILITYSSQAELSDEDMEGYDELSLYEKSQLKDAAYDALTADEQAAVDAKAKEQAEAVLALVNQEGSDFDALIAEYGWDPGMEYYTDGYTMTKNSAYVEEFLNAAFELGVGETSQIVETDYGYHILKRMEITDDYITENLEDIYSEYCDEVYSAKDNELMTAILAEMEVTYCDEYANFTYDSIS